MRSLGKASKEQCISAYRHHSWRADSVNDLELAPFHLLASEGVVHFDKSPEWRFIHKPEYSARRESSVRLRFGPVRGHVPRMSHDTRLIQAGFPRASTYHPDWVIANASGGANALWLIEWLAPSLNLKPGMRVLDLGCGRVMSSIFLHREYGVQVWATDLWISASENLQRLRDVGVDGGVFPLHCDARSLPFAAGFFDAIVCVDCLNYFGTDDLYLNYLAQFVKPGGAIGMVGAGLISEIESGVPEALRPVWAQGFWSFHSAAWWRRHWERTGIVGIEVAETMPDGWKRWVEWQRAVAPDNTAEIQAVEADAGRTLGYIRVMGRRRDGVALEDYCWPDTLKTLVPSQYTRKPLLRGNNS